MIKRVADSIDPTHKVNLGAPDKVILVDIYQVWPSIFPTKLRC